MQHQSAELVQLGIRLDQRRAGVGQCHRRRARIGLGSLGAYRAASTATRAASRSVSADSRAAPSDIRKHSISASWSAKLAASTMPRSTNKLTGASLAASAEAIAIN